MAKFWEDLGFLSSMDLDDKILVGNNSDGATMYTSLQAMYDKISKTYFTDAKPSVIPAGTVLTTPQNLTYHIAPAGTYTLPTGQITLTGNINFLFWDFTNEWSWLEFHVGIKDSTVSTSKIEDFAVTTSKLGDLAVTEEKIAEKSISFSKFSFLKNRNSGFALTALNHEGRKVKIAEMSNSGIWKLLLDSNSIADNSILKEKLEASIVSQLNLLSMFRTDDNNERGDLLKLLSFNKKKVLTITADGEIKGLFDFSLRKVRRLDISDDIYLPSVVEFNSEYDKYFYKIRVVGPEGRIKILMGATKDGHLHGDFVIKNKSITSDHISDDLEHRLPDKYFIKQNAYNEHDFISCDDADENYNTEVIDFPIYTSEYGALFKTLAPMKTNGVKFTNTTGFDIELTNATPIIIKGQKSLGDYSPEQDVLQTYKGWFLYNNIQLPQSPVLGDYYLCVFFHTASKTTTVSGVTFSEWDMLYFDGTSWRIQSCPATSTTLQNGVFFDIMGRGKYLDISLSEGDKLIYLGIKAGGGWNEPVFVKQKKGDFFFRGLSTTSFNFLQLNRNDLIVISNTGVVGGFSVNRGDYVYKDEDGIIGVVLNSIKTIPNGYSLFVPCKNTNEFAVRRADNENIKTLIQATSTITTKLRSINKDMVCMSDSMFGSNVWQNIVPLFPERNVALESFGGASSYNILVMLKKMLYTKQDYKGRIWNFWHGQNNATDTTQIKEVALAFASLATNANYKFTMWSILGSTEMEFNGERLRCPIHESAFTGDITSSYVQVENWYDKVFRGKHFSTRKKALEASVGRERKHLQFPGLTEGQVAQQYGIPAFSFFFDYNSVEWLPEDLNFIGYHSSIGLPIGGNHFDYRIRVENGKVGAIIVKINSNWVEYSHDVVHVTQEGGELIAQKFKEFINNLNY